jgi:hypothetical protein
MRKVTMSYMDFPLGLRVTFVEGQRGLGRVLNFTDDTKTFELLRRVHASLEDHNIVEESLRHRRAGMVELRLTDEQYTSLIAYEFGSGAFGNINAFTGTILYSTMSTSEWTPTQVLQETNYIPSKINTRNLPPYAGNYSRTSDHLPRRFSVGRTAGYSAVDLGIDAE